jgi:hypothetical protein
MYTKRKEGDASGKVKTQVLTLQDWDTQVAADSHGLWLHVNCVYIGPPAMYKMCLRWWIQWTGAEQTLLFSNPTKFQGPTAVMDGYGGYSILLWRYK